MGKTKKCPFCSETIQHDAKKCRYCGEWLKNNSPTKQVIRNKNFNYKRILLVLSLGIIICLVASRLFYGRTISGGYSHDLSGLKQKILYDYAHTNGNVSKETLRYTYRNLSPESRDLSEEEWLNRLMNFLTSEGIKFIKKELNDVMFDGIDGYADVTAYFCFDSTCNTVFLKTRNWSRYVYSSSKWFSSNDEVLCPRKSKYSIEPEFERVLSLMEQRFSNEKNDVTKIFNCVNIKYAENSNELNEAEGVFKFIPGQSSIKLDILVSPKYKIKDDLITSILIMHELIHALDYVGDLQTGKVTNCYEAEARAFGGQNFFLTILNNEEKQSLNSRLLTGGSPELKNIFTVWNSIPKYNGNTYNEKALNYVKSQTFYQKQCSK